MENSQVNIPILVVSCDAYQDVWHPFFYYFFKNWRDCPYPVYLVSNKLKYPDSRVSPLLVGSDVDYSSNLIKALHQIPDEWLIFWIDDRPPAIPVDTARLAKLILLAQEKDAGCLKLIPCNPLSLTDEKDAIGEIPKNSQYLVSMTIALWKKSTLLKVLQPGESAWDIEKRGGVQRSRELEDKFYALPIHILKNPPLLDIHLITKGKLRWQASKFLEQENLLTYLENRSKVSLRNYIYDKVFYLIWDSYFYLKWQLKKIQKFK